MNYFCYSMNYCWRVPLSWLTSRTVMSYMKISAPDKSIEPRGSGFQLDNWISRPGTCGLLGTGQWWWVNFVVKSEVFAPCWVNGWWNCAGRSVKFGFYSHPMIRLCQCELLSEKQWRLGGDDKLKSSLKTHKDLLIALSGRCVSYHERHMVYLLVSLLELVTLFFRSEQ